MKSFKTEQETFWAEEFGDAYVDRNRDAESIAHRTDLFSKILRRTRRIRHVLELGANIGFNFRAIKTLLPGCEFSGVEINDKAVASLKQLPDTRVFQGSILDQSAADLGRYDLTLTSGVLIHIHPEFLADVYELLYACSNRYILVIEYYNPTPVEVPYRGHSERLYKRDFAGEILDRYDDLELVDYGFQYHRDDNFPADDVTWFLMSKRR